MNGIRGLWSSGRTLRNDFLFEWSLLMQSFFSWLQGLFSKKPKTNWDSLPYKDSKYVEPDIKDRNQV